MGICWSDKTSGRQDEHIREKSGSLGPRYGEEHRGTLLAKCVSIYDGDTFTALIVIERRALRRWCSCIGYNSPEIRGAHADRANAVAARDELQKVMPSGVFLLTFEGTDKYGRLLVKFRVGGGEWLADHMVRTGHGCRYDGGNKRHGTQSKSERCRFGSDESAPSSPSSAP